MSKRKNYGEFYNKQNKEDLTHGLKDGIISEDVDVKAKAAKIAYESVKAVDGEYPVKDREFSMIPTLGVVANCNKLNVRKEPNAGSEIIAVLDKGNQVEIVGESNGFRKVKIDDTFGWCMSFYIEETE